jgi:hypothetical protein
VFARHAGRLLQQESNVEVEAKPDIEMDESDTKDPPQAVEDNAEPDASEVDPWPQFASEPDATEAKSDIEMDDTSDTNDPPQAVEENEQGEAVSAGSHERVSAPPPAAMQPMETGEVAETGEVEEEATKESSSSTSSSSSSSSSDDEAAVEAPHGEEHRRGVDWQNQYVQEEVRCRCLGGRDGCRPHLEAYVPTGSRTYMPTGPTCPHWELLGHVCM